MEPRAMPAQGAPTPLGVPSGGAAGEEAVHTCMALCVCQRIALDSGGAAAMYANVVTLVTQRFMLHATAVRLCRVAWSVRATSTGSWTAHILAGTALLLWALHWNQAIFRGWLTQGRTQRPFRSHATYPVPFLPERWPVEAVAKVVLPLVAILVTLVGSSGWRSNICSEGTPREGHFDPENIYRYANVWVLFSVLASGEQLDKACCRHVTAYVLHAVKHMSAHVPAAQALWTCWAALLSCQKAPRHSSLQQSSCCRCGCRAANTSRGRRLDSRQNLLLLLHADSQHCR